MIKKTWKELQDSGLLFIINQTLHIFGWAIVFIIADDTGEIIDVYPARVKFRGFKEKSVEQGYIKISEYMALNAEELLKEVIL